ncbi:peroxiredoxin-like family protein [Nocardia sp. NPDC048505]|uniref:peroxiredoxin-like family protein n=1 Tax=unclassified Nocardia TaxID=2637762 RepID=UPI0033D87ABB
MVLSFYRGGWCPFCNLELRLLQQSLPEFHARGARLVAISPETPDRSLDTVRAHTLEFAVLSDPELTAIRAYELEYVVAESIRETFRATGTDLAASGWRLDAAA